MNSYLAELDSQDLRPLDAMAVFLVGSVALGWDNELSDHDFCIVTRTAWSSEQAQAQAQPVPLQPNTVSAVVTHVDGRRWEIKYWLDSQVDQMLAKVSHDRFESGSNSAAMLADGEELFLRRLETCLPVLGSDWVERRRDELARSAFRSYLVTRSLARADDSVEDASGLLAAGDVFSAVLSARAAFGHTMDALLDSCGRAGPRGAKWRAKRFRDAAPAQVPFETYWAFEAMTDLDPNAPEKWVERVVDFCKELTLEIEIG